MECKPGAGSSTFPDGTGIDSDNPEIILASVTFAGKTGACINGKDCCCGTDIQVFVKSEKIKTKLC